ncbi:MAG: hypothetical protein KA763_10475 [Xanthomonadales bacterium]|nr:hypothetical protein [Xanthomonadales bacterium]
MQLQSLGLALNPCASISVQGGSEPPLFLVRAPIKGAHICERLVTPDELPAAHGFLAAALIRGEAVDLVSEQGVDELRGIGLLAPIDALPQPVHYDLSTERHGRLGAVLDRPQAVASAGEPMLGRGLRLPEDWSDLPLRFRPHHHGSVWAPILADSDADAMPPANAAAGEFDSLATRDFFAREGYVELHDLLPASHVAELARYYWALAGEGFLQLDDHRGCLRHIAHSHPVADFWHDQLNARVSQLVGCATKPSYSFVSLYREGGDLKWHVDRPPCEYTITLLVDYAPLDAADRSPWALKLRARDGRTRELHQRVGDALIFKGRELKHSRDVLPTGHRSASLLFHFVDADYDGVMA